LPSVSLFVSFSLCLPLFLLSLSPLGLFLVSASVSYP
jgi:hypothetical protein